MPRNLQIVALVAVVAMAALAPMPALASDHASMRDTVQVVRETGVRLYAYVNGWMAGSGVEEKGGWDEETTTADWSSCQSVTWDEVTTMIGGDGNPIRDGWGNPLEVCVALDNLDSGRHVIGVRSAGSDGKFGGPAYEIGPFDEKARGGADVVWMDGYFMTWPQKPVD